MIDKSILKELHKDFYKFFRKHKVKEHILKGGLIQIHELSKDQFNKQFFDLELIEKGKEQGELCIYYLPLEKFNTLTNSTIQNIFIHYLISYDKKVRNKFGN